MGFVRLTRPVNVVICGCSVVCGGILRGKPFDRLDDIITFFLQPGYGNQGWMLRLLAGAISASLILAAGNAFNDVRDIHCDRINAPDRPIPIGAVSTSSAVIFSGILALSGLFLSLVLGTAGFAIALSAVLMLAMYDIKLKSVPLAGNIVVAALGGLAFVYGGLAGQSVFRALLPAFFAFFLHAGRELVKDAADVRGDSLAGITTAATAWGKRTACALASAVLLMLAALVVVPFVLGYFGKTYFIIIALGVLPVLLYASLSPFHDISEKNLRWISLLLKLDMPVGIMAVIVGFQGW